MAFSFGFFSDRALTTPLHTSLVFVQSDSAPTPEDKVIFFGSLDASASVMAVSSPGVAPITVSVIDTALGAGSPSSDVKLALSSGGLAAAVGGAALSLPATIAGGVSNAIPIYIRVTDTTHAAGVKADLSLTTNLLGQL